MAYKKKEIETVLKDVFGIEYIDLNSDEYLEDALIWDSFMIVNLLTEIDRKYHKKIDFDALFAVKTVSELGRLIGEIIS